MLSALVIAMALEIATVPAADVFEEQQVTHIGEGGQRVVFRYRLLKPAEVVAGKKYPVILFLHGAGERGTDNVSQLAYLPQQMAQPEWRKKFPCFLIAPQCPPEKRWVEVDWGDKKSTPQGEPTPVMKAVIQMLDQVIEQNPVDPKRIYLTGLSMGGYGAWDLALRTPERFAAVVPICGGGDESKAARLVGLSIWAWHGDADNAVPVERSRSMIAAIRKAGGNPKYTELKGVGHNSWTPAYEGPDGVLPWLFEQQRP